MNDININGTEKLDAIEMISTIDDNGAETLLALSTETIDVSEISLITPFEVTDTNHANTFNERMIEIDGALVDRVTEKSLTDVTKEVSIKNLAVGSSVDTILPPFREKVGYIKGERLHVQKFISGGRDYIEHFGQGWFIDEASHINNPLATHGGILGWGGANEFSNLRINGDAQSSANETHHMGVGIMFRNQWDDETFTDGEKPDLAFGACSYRTTGADITGLNGKLAFACIEKNKSNIPNDYKYKFTPIKAKEFIISELDRPTVYTEVFDGEEKVLDFAKFKEWDAKVGTVDLENYYLKNETLSKEEVNTLIGQIEKMSIKKVDALPDTGEKGFIYLVPKVESANNVFDEYIWFEEKWEHIGDTEIDLSDYYVKSETDTKINTKVDKVNGKQLSTNDYTTVEKTKLASLANYDDRDILADIEIERKRIKVVEDTKVDKVANKQLSTNDYTTAEKTKLAGLSNYNDTTITANISTINSQLLLKADKSELPTKVSQLTNDSNFITKSVTDLVNYNTKIETTNLLSNKVDKVNGKQLSTNDYTTVEKTKLTGLANYNDTALKTRLTNVETELPLKSSITYVDGKVAPITIKLGDIDAKLLLKADKSELPTKVSQLTNDSLFITNTANNLTNYYNQTEINNLISAVSTISLLIVSTLPTIGEANIIYLVSKAGTLNNVYNEFIWLTDKYEQIGSTEVDLSNYYNKVETDTKLNTKVDKVSGKVLSTNDYTTAEKTKLTGLNNYNDTVITTNINALNTKVDTKQPILNIDNAGSNVTITEVGGIVKINSVNGSVGTTDHTALTNREVADQHPIISIIGLTEGLASKQPTGDYVTNAIVTTKLNTKVDKVSGKVLSTNDYTTAEKTKLTGLVNYNDTALKTRLTNIETELPLKASIVYVNTTVQTATSTLTTKTYVDTALQNAIGAVLGGSF